MNAADEYGEVPHAARVLANGLTNTPVAPPTTWSLLGWDPPVVPVLPVVAVTLAAWYLLGVVRMGRSWPWWSTMCFLSGCLILAAIMGLSIEGYGFRLFSAFMFQQLTLSILVPPLLVLGLRSRAAAYLLHPAVTIPLFLFSYYGLYLSQLFDSSAATWLGHNALEIFFLVTGLLFVIPILSTDPLPIRQTNLGRMFDIFVEMSLHVFIGVVLMMAPRPLIGICANPPAQWAVDPVKDQAETAMREADEARQEDELASYNRFLRQLHGGRSDQGA